MNVVLPEHFDGPSRAIKDGQMQHVKPALFSFFSGAGFLDLGFEVAGFQTAFVNEYHRPFLDAYKFARQRLGISRPMFGYLNDDIGVLLDDKESSILSKRINTARDHFGLVGFIGGPPCPDFSVGGKNRGRHGENGILSDVYAKLICAQQPDFFVFENVKGLWRTKMHRAFYDEIKLSFESSGYILTERLINSIEYGAPQDRDRIILIGFRRNSFHSL